MSESSAFANYSNTTQQLRNAIDQDGASTEQVTNDKANFEQQFLIGASLMAKEKATEAFVGILKKSKKLKALRGKTEDAVKKLAQSAQDRAESVSKELLNKVTNPPTTPSDLDNLIGERDEATATRDATRISGAEADTELAAAREGLATATRDSAAADIEKTFTEDTSQFARAGANADKVLQTAAEKARDKIPQTRIKDDDPKNMRTEPNPDYEEAANKAAEAAETAKRSEEGAQAAQKAGNAAKTASTEQQAALEAATARNAAAEASSAALSDTLKEHEAIATEAENAVRTEQAATAAASSKAAEVEKIAKQVSQPGGEDAAEAAAAAATKGVTEAERLAKLEQAAKAAKETEEAAAASEGGGDVAGFLVAGLAALATQFIGRKIKAHENINVGGVGAGVIPKLNFSSTLGA